MTTKEISIENIENIASEYTYALVYEFSRVIMTAAVQVKWEPEELSEAYLFSKEKQVHIFRTEGQLRAVEMVEGPEDDHYVDRRYELDNKFMALGQKLVVREYLEADEDGQAVVIYTRLVDVE